MSRAVTLTLWYMQQLMRLQAQPPLWMGQAVAQTGSGILGLGRAIHRLQEEVGEIEM